MDVLVTGAAGFLGGAVARHLLERGHHVVGFDRRASDLDVEWVIGDLTDRQQLHAVPEVQAIAHLGAVGDVYLAADDPGLAASVNVVGSARIAEFAIERRARLVNASTWEVYGPPVYQPIDERHPCAPDHPYSITKLAGESLIMTATELGGLDAVSLRLGTAYGPGMRPNSVFSIFGDRARRGLPLEVHGGGSQGRQFTHSSDIARAFEMALVRGRGVFNVVAEEWTTIRGLAERIAGRYGTEVVVGPTRAGDVPDARVSAERAHGRLGWSAEVEFSEGLEALLEATESG